MGQLLTTLVSTRLVNYLRSLQEEGYSTVFTCEDHDMLFRVNKNPGEHTPKWWILIKNTSIVISDDLRIDAQPLRIKSSAVTIEIGRIVLTCHDLGYAVSITGRLTLFDVLVKVSFTPKFDKGIRISDIGADIAVDRIESQVVVRINNIDHSPLANVLLNIEDPALAANVLNAIFLISKVHILKQLNSNIEEIVRKFSRRE